jgi:pyruvate/2-oxoglutarate/acetoin dehydrogenase E1 component
MRARGVRDPMLREMLFDELDAPVNRLCMEDAPVPYATVGLGFISSFIAVHV